MRLDRIPLLRPIALPRRWAARRALVCFSSSVFSTVSARNTKVQSPRRCIFRPILAMDVPLALHLSRGGEF
ncbi:hypothetical protein EDB82DRAFT_509311 [Fusarium venenatum]|uniref:uncharacterized protein n=1 Tax=Fusarium venenatum TaxID=56646 RepID=UPI001D503130|nr:hypothetical protein EDB82DRAFT_509311 [Fusarium venenatum]